MKDLEIKKKESFINKNLRGGLWNKEQTKERKSETFFLLSFFICSKVVCEASYVPAHLALAYKRYLTFKVTRMGSSDPTGSQKHNLHYKYWLY